MSRREKLEIVNDMLVAIQDKGGSIKPTHLLYKSNLSHKKMMEHIQELLSSQMIEEAMEDEKELAKEN